MSLCCNAHQIDVIVAVCAYTVLILGTWRVETMFAMFDESQWKKSESE